MKVEKIQAQKLDTLDTLIESGIYVRTAVFQGSINSFNTDGKTGIPETALYEASSNPQKTRIAEMYYTQAGLICIQKYGTVIVPLPNLKWVRVK